MIQENSDNTTLEFYDCRHLHVVLAKPECPLTFTELLAYSFLVYRIDQARGEERRGAANVQKLSAGTGLDVKQIRPAIERLIQLGLVRNDGLSRIVSRSTRFSSDESIPAGEAWELHVPTDFAQTTHKLVALVPPEDWFCTKRNTSNRPWYDQLAYFRMTIPRETKFSVRHLALIGYIRSFPGHRQVYYANGLRINPKTAQRCVSKLEKLGAFSAPMTLKPDFMATVKPERKPKMKKPNINTRSLADFFREKIPVGMRLDFYESYEQLINHAEVIGQLMATANISPTEAEAYWREVMNSMMEAFGNKNIAPFEYFMSRFRQMLEWADSVTDSNRQSGTFHGPNCLGLLRSDLRRVVAEMKCVGPYGSALLLWHYTPPH